MSDTKNDDKKPEHEECSVQITGEQSEALKNMARAVVFLLSGPLGEGQKRGDILAVTCNELCKLLGKTIALTSHSEEHLKEGLDITKTELDFFANETYSQMAAFKKTKLN